MKNKIVYLFVLLNIGFSYSQKESLEFSSVDFSIVRDSIEKNKKVESIKIHQCPDFLWDSTLICDLANLKKLIIIESGIDTIPSWIANTKIEKLVLARNKIKLLNGEIFRSNHLKEVEVMEVEMCKIVNLPRQNQKLESLDLSGCNFNSFAYEYLKSFKKLWKLSLRDNRLNQFVGDANLICESLRFLDLSSNQLISFPNDYCYTFPNLTTLLLHNNNKLECIKLNENCFNKLESLYLQNACLKSFVINEGLSHLKKLHCSRMSDSLLLNSAIMLQEIGYYDSEDFIVELKNVDSLELLRISNISHVIDFYNFNSLKQIDFIIEEETNSAFIISSLETITRKKRKTMIIKLYIDKNLFTDKLTAELTEKILKLKFKKKMISIQIS